jgi:LPXTG-motif cell wall-anchored protein
MPRRALTSILVALLLALVPACAFANGAGDDQYQDPLTAPSAPKKPKNKPAPAATPAPATSTAPAATTAPAASAAPAPAAAPAGELPRTGAPTDLLGLTGAVMLGAGVVLRRRTAAQ